MDYWLGTKNYPLFGLLFSCPHRYTVTGLPFVFFLFVLWSPFGAKLSLYTVYVVFIVWCVFLKSIFPRAKYRKRTGNVTIVQNWCDRARKTIHMACNSCAEQQPQFSTVLIFSKNCIAISLHAVERKWETEVRFFFLKLSLRNKFKIKNWSENNLKFGFRM